MSVSFVLCFRARLFIDVLWSPAGKGLTSWPGVWKYQNYLLVPGQLNGHNVLVQRKFYLSERTYLLRYRMAGITESAMVAYTHKYAVV